MSAFSKHELYGGAITVDLPEDYVDASDLRQVPSHQEVFLSRNTLTSIIIELNTRLSGTDDAVAPIHFTDPIVAPDTAAVTSTLPVTLAAPSLASCPAYLISGTITSYAKGGAAEELKSWLLLVRIESKSTDLCVRLNVPVRELTGGEMGREEELAREIMEKIVGSLDVRDWGLFVD